MPVSAAATDNVAISAVSGPANKILPAYLTFHQDRALLKVGETATFTLSVTGDGVFNNKGLQLLLDLPNGLTTTSGTKGKLRWDVPALTPGTVFAQSIQVIIDKPKQALKQGVLTMRATLSAPSYDDLAVTQWLGVAPTTPTPETQATADGAVLQNGAGDVVLLVKPGAVANGVTFRYTELHRSKHQKPVAQGRATQPLAQSLVSTATQTTTQTITQTATQTITQPTRLDSYLYLPLVGNGSDGDVNNSIVNTLQTNAVVTGTPGIAGTVPPPTNTIQPISDHNVDAYAIWQLDAEQNATRVPTFTEDIELVVALTAWVAQGWTQRAPACGREKAPPSAGSKSIANMTKRRKACALGCPISANLPWRKG